MGKSLVKKVSDIQKLPDDKRQVVMALLDAFLKQTKLQSTPLPVAYHIHPNATLVVACSYDAL